MKKILPILLLVVFVACSSSPSIYSDEEIEKIRKEKAENTRKRKTLEKFLSYTPHELCQDNDTLKRYENKEECKKEISKKQDVVRAEITKEDADMEARRQIAIGILGNQIVNQPTNNTNQYFIQTNKQTSPMVRPNPQLNCTTTPNPLGGSQTTCR